MSEITREAEICDHCGTDERTLGQLTRRAEAAERERDLATGQILMVGSEIGGDPKLDPMDYRDPRWTPTLEEAAKLRAEAERLRGALEALSTAERHYRDMYQCHGGQALDTGRAWDMLRKAGIEARATLAKVKETNHTQVMRCGATLKSTIKTFRCEKGEGHDEGHRAEHPQSRTRSVPRVRRGNRPRCVLVRDTT